MDYTTLPQRIREIDNLSDFIRRSGLPRRTIERMKTGGGNPNLETCKKIADALQRIKPAKRKAPAPDAPAAA